MTKLLRLMAHNPPTKMRVVNSLPGTGYAGQRVLFYRYPKVGSAPAVTNGMRFVLAGAIDREYLGVAGSWVPQDNIARNPWYYTGTEWKYDYGQIVPATLDFANGIYPWQSLFTNSANFSVVEIMGKTAGMFSLGPNELWTNPDTGGQSARSELRLFGTAKCGATIDYEWDFMIPSDYVESADWQLVGQFRDQPNPITGDTWASYPAHSPPVAFQYKEGQFQIVVVDNFTTNHVSAIISVPITKGVWHNLKSRIFWSTTASGTLSSKLDDVQLTASGQSVYQARNSFNEACNILAIGLYRSSAIASAARIYFANIKSTLISQV